MTVRVKLFAGAREIAAAGEVCVETAEAARVEDVHRAVAEAFPALRSILPHCLWAVDGQYATRETRIAAGCEVALIPPVSGG